MKYLIITKSDHEDRYGCLIDNHPEQLSDFRDADGNPASVVVSVPIMDAIAACKSFGSQKQTATNPEGAPQ